jgi:hypothetical protein
VEDVVEVCTVEVAEVVWGVDEVGALVEDDVTAWLDEELLERADDDGAGAALLEWAVDEDVAALLAWLEDELE